MEVEEGVEMEDSQDGDQFEELWCEQCSKELRECGVDFEFDEWGTAWCFTCDQAIADAALNAGD